MATGLLAAAFVDRLAFFAALAFLAGLLPLLGAAAGSGVPATVCESIVLLIDFSQPPVAAVPWIALAGRNGQWNFKQ
jgi:hypothetical protein